MATSSDGASGSRGSGGSAATVTTMPVDEHALAARLRLAVGRLNRRIRVDAHATLPPLQTSVLATLADHEPLRLSELARREAVTPPTMSRVLAALDENGLLVRTPDPHDARSALVQLSECGHETITRMRTERTVVLAERLDRLDEEQRVALEAALPALEELVRDA